MNMMMMMSDSDSDSDSIEAHFEHEMAIILAYQAAIEGESSGDDGSSAEDHHCSNRENSNCHPQVKWTQRLDKIFIKVQLSGANDINVKLEPEGIFTFSSTVGADDNSYELTLKLHDEVNVEESKITKGVGNVFCLLEKAKRGWWRELFSGNEETPRCVKVDWNKWVDEGHGNVGNVSVLDLFSKAQSSDKTRKEKSRKMSIGAEQKFQKRKSQKTSLKHMSSTHKEAANTWALPSSNPMLAPARPSFNQGRSSTGGVPHNHLTINASTHVGCVPESKDCLGLSSSLTEVLLQQIINVSLGAAAAVQLVQAIKAEHEGLNGGIKVKNDELEQMRKEIQERKAQFEKKVASFEVAQRLYEQERLEHLKKFEQEKAGLMKNFEQEMAKTKTKYEAVADDIFYQVWRNNQEGNFRFLGEEVEKVIAGFKQRLAEETEAS